MRKIVSWSVLTGCCMVLAVWPAPAAPWARFRGPNGTGVAPDRDIPIKWDEKEGILWKVPIGPGNSSPVVWGDQVFVQSAVADASERKLLCLSAGDGKVLWSRSVTGVPFKTLNRFNTYASSTPAADGERVYVIFWDGEGQTVHAYDFKGNPLWQHNLGPFQSQHGAGASPVVHDGKLFINHDQDGSAAVVALDARTGKRVWEEKRPAFRACYSVPFLLERPGGGPALVVASTAGLTAYHPHDGSTVWNYTWSFQGMALRTVGSPLYHQGMIFAPSGDGGGARDMIAIRADGKGDVTKTHLLWRNRGKKGSLLPYVPTILAHGDHLYYTSDLGVACCAVAKTGEVAWTARLGGGSIFGSPVLIDGKVYAVNENGEVFVFPASPDGLKLLATNELGETVRSSPSVADGRLFLRGEKHLFCIGKAAGK